MLYVRMQIKKKLNSIATNDKLGNDYRFNYVLLFT